MSINYPRSYTFWWTERLQPKITVSLDQITIFVCPVRNIADPPRKGMQVNLKDFCSVETLLHIKYTPHFLAGTSCGQSFQIDLAMQTMNCPSPPWLHFSLNPGLHVDHQIHLYCFWTPPTSPHYFSQSIQLLPSRTSRINQVRSFMLIFYSRGLSS